MKNKKPISQEKKEAIATKAKLLERESNITLVSVSVAIVSFLMMLYVHNAVAVNYITAQKMCGILKYILLAAALGTVVVGIWKKKFYLFEYSVFTLILAGGYYLIEYPGISGIPFIYKEFSDGTIQITEFGAKLAPYFNTTYIVYGLWTVNVLYCVYAIVVHSVRYTKIKNHSKKDIQGKKA